MIQLLDGLGNIVILCGRAGVGKTNLALNLALAFSARGESVTAIDLDVVNPYFRTCDYEELLAAQGIRVIASQAAGTTLDLPALSAAVDAALDSGKRLILDAGGGGHGSAVLGRYAPRILELGDYTMLYVLNRYRMLPPSPEEALSDLAEIEGRSRLRAAGLVNNSHLSVLTKMADIERALPFSQTVSGLSGLPLLCTTAPAHLRQGPEDERFFWVDRLVKNPWE